MPMPGESGCTLGSKRTVALRCERGSREGEVRASRDAVSNPAKRRGGATRVTVICNVAVATAR